MFEKSYLYSYDNNGNITCKEIRPYAGENGTVISYTYDKDRLISYNGENCVYDIMGNPTTYRGKSATWKYGRRLISFDGNTFKYDGQGHRIEKNGITFTYDSQGRLIKQGNGLEFFYDNTGLLGLKYNSKTYIYQKDIQGNIIAVLDSNGNIVVEYFYDAWGNHEVSGSLTIGNLNPFRYRSYYFDTETNLYFLQTRYYDPEVGRFLNMDSPDYADPETVNGLNLYAYCNNNPVMNIDPTGHSWLSALLKVVLAVAIVAVAAVVAVATAGTAVGVIAAGAAIGGAVGAVASGTASAVGAAINGEDVFEGFADGMLSGSITGTISGAVAASSVGTVGQIAFNASLSGLQYGVDGLINNKPFDPVDFAISLGCGALAGYAGGAGALNTAGKALGGVIYQREVIRAIGKVSLNSTIKYLVNPIAKSTVGTGVSFVINEIKYLINKVSI